ncbi:MAG: crossover junction endodeoxyribonuclease RuvC [Anaerolineae bacterium]|nr:crossover junction endodeoxyribonuclease RuvC [Anaerolineae bacterium]
MLSLGIDPGTAIVGYGLVQESEDGSYQALAYGVIRTPPHESMPERLASIYEALRSLIAQYRPDRAAIEEMFFGRNVTTAITVAQGRGVILLALQQASLPIYQYKPSVVKQSITGYGGAEKNQMQEMVRLLLNLASIPQPDDAADALAIALTDLQSRHFEGYDIV